MFVEHKEAGENALIPGKTLKLSEAIRLGCLTVTEQSTYCGCAVGAAYTFVTGRDLHIDQNLPESVRLVGRPCGYAVVAKMFGVPEKIVEVASSNHLYGKWSRKQCAEYIEAQGY